nr:tetratricopeptide repeat protein [uncultured Treponema sp.]
MTKKNSCRQFVEVAAFSIFLFSSCGSSPVVQPQMVDDGYVNEEEAVSVTVVSPKKKSFFSMIKQTDIDAVEIGSPQSLRLAYNSLHRSVDEKYTDAERTLLCVICAMMDLAWPSESGSYVSPKILVPDQYTGAVDSVRRGIYDLSTNSSDFLSAVLPSLALLSSGNMDEYYPRAQESLDKALSMRPDSVIANYLMGILCVRTGRNQEALKYLAVANGKYSSGTREILFAIADTYYRSGNNEMALSIGEQLLITHPQDTSVLDLCSKSAYAMGDLDKTESYIVRMLLIDPDNTDYVLFRAKILMQKQDFIRASSLLDVCARKSQMTREYYILRTRLQYDWNKNYAGAAETAFKAYSLYPNDVEIMLLAAENASASGKSIDGSSAMEVASRVLEKDGSNAKALSICVTELCKIEDYQKAYGLSSRLIKLADSTKEDLYRHIDICLALRRTTEANSIATKLYGSSPSDEDAQMAYIKVMVSSGQSASALRIIEDLLPESNVRMKSFLYYERSFLRTSEDQVLADLRSSLTANPRNKDSLYRLYRIYYGKKDWRRAQYYLKQVVALDPSNATYVRQNSELDGLLRR